MKRLTPICIALLLVACGGPRDTKTTAGAVFDISPELLSARVDTLVDLGTLREGEVVRYDARLRNSGVEPLVIVEVRTSCGCTRVEYTREPIAPGAEGELSFQFDSRGMWGIVRRLIEIETSAAPDPLKIMVQAEVTDKN